MNNIDSGWKILLVYDCEEEIKIYLECRTHEELEKGSRISLLSFKFWLSHSVVYLLEALISSTV